MSKFTLYSISQLLGPLGLSYSVNSSLESSIQLLQLPENKKHVPTLPNVYTSMDKQQLMTCIYPSTAIKVKQNT